mmetsp:Transcript_5426/g.19093  ORF Transcript_5426/g.19093 Transcript_5426/m.19093 type:complete len:83 (-) Transcript_5426:1837-2085(-)
MKKQRERRQRLSQMDCARRLKEGNEDENERRGRKQGDESSGNKQGSQTGSRRHNSGDRGDDWEEGKGCGRKEEELEGSGFSK